jgi:hypothetical protein
MKPGKGEKEGLPLKRAFLLLCLPALALLLVLSKIIVSIYKTG